MRSWIIACLAAVVVWLGAEASGRDGRSSDAGIPDLENQLTALENELEGLASFTMRTDVGDVGYRSEPHEKPVAEEWVEVDLGESYDIDVVYLVPAIWRSGSADFRADGFPVVFRVLFGLDGEWTEVASFDKETLEAPKVAPLKVPTSGHKADRIRIEASELAPSIWTKHIFHLSEILAFSGSVNVAFDRDVTCRKTLGVVWRPGLLTDGELPYLMDAATGERSTAYLANLDPEAPGATRLHLALGEISSIDRIDIHRLDLSDTVPQMMPSDYGLPRRMVVRGGMAGDGSDSVELAEFRIDVLGDAAPMMGKRCSPTSCRHLWFEIVEPDRRHERWPSVDQGEWIFGLSEIEVLSKGQNVALGKLIEAPPGGDRARHASALTDGRNLYGDILPMREWMRQLERREELERKIPEIRSELAGRYAGQRRLLKALASAVGLLALGVIALLVLSKVGRLREMAALRQRLAADLHDELGASLHSIGLLSDMAQKFQSDPERQSSVIAGIRAESEATGRAVRRCTEVMEGRRDFPGLIDDMRQIADRVSGDLSHEFDVSGAVDSLDFSSRALEDIYLFYRECLVNLSRHSEAKRFTTSLDASTEGIRLTVRDDGVGLNSEDEVPRSLRRRAKVLGAAVSSKKPADGGTEITLNWRAK